MSDSAGTILSVVLTAGGGLVTAVTVLWKSFNGQVVRLLEQQDKAEKREEIMSNRIKGLEENRLRDEKDRSDKMQRAINRLADVLGDRPCLANTNVLGPETDALERKNEESDYPCAPLRA